MSKPSMSKIEQMIQIARPTNRDLVRYDIIQVLNSSVSRLLLRTLPYYDGETIKDLLCFYGTVDCQYQGNHYNIPVKIWLQQDHPKVAPLVYVKPTEDMYVSTMSRDVQPDGTVIIPYLRSWRYPMSDMTTLLTKMSEAFSVTPPVYTISSATNLKPYPTTTYPSNPKPSSLLDNSASVAYPAPYPMPYPTPINSSNPKVFSCFDNNTSISQSNASLSIAHGQTSNETLNNVHSDSHTHRFVDVAAEPRRMLLPIQGYENMPLVSLEEAVIPLVSLVSDVKQMVWITKQNCIHPKDGLTPDESASIMLYTMEWEPYEKSFYVLLNKALRSSKLEELKPWFSYLRLFITAHEKLQSTGPVVHRGIKLDLTEEYRRGETVVWWGFSSCTSSIETLQNERFLGKNGTRTLFNIESSSGKNICSHSFYPGEDEILLLPARQFQVLGCLDQGNGLQIVQLKETKPEFPLIKLPS